MKLKLPKIVSLGDVCCGCGACAAKCAKSCIEMASDTCGFLRPKVDIAVCAECGACDAVCPVLCGNPDDGLESVIWAKSKNQAEILTSSSGGIFALLAHDVLSTRGGVRFRCFLGERLQKCAPCAGRVRRRTGFNYAF